MGVRSEGGYLQHRLPAHTRPHGISRDANTWMHIIFFLTNAHKNKHAHTREERNRYPRRHTISQHKHARRSLPSHCNNHNLFILGDLRVVKSPVFHSHKKTFRFTGSFFFKNIQFFKKIPLEPSRRLQSFALCHSWNPPVFCHRKLMVIQEETRCNRLL